MKCMVETANRCPLKKGVRLIGYVFVKVGYNCK